MRYQTRDALLPLPTLPAATTPAEVRLGARDAARLLVSDRGGVTHSQMSALDAALRPGDVLVVNRSQTLPSSLPTTTPGLRIHLSTRLGGDRHILELRTSDDGTSTQPYFEATSGLVIGLPGGEHLRLVRPHASTPQERPRLWVAQGAALDLEYLERHGRPIRYDYSGGAYPLWTYQTDLGSEPGSAEMPSAGRGITPRVLRALERRGVELAPITLHCGVASLEAHEPPHEEYMRVEAETLAQLERARARGGRVIAVGTTALRALITCIGEDGRWSPFEGWTTRLIEPGDDLSWVDGLISGFHPPGASHVQILGALASAQHLHRAYHAALDAGYLSHELGDLHLLWRDI